MTDLPMAQFRILGLDVGRSRIGVARSTALGTAEPLETLHVRNRPVTQTIERLAQLCVQHQISQFVVGLPRNMDGSLGPQAEYSQRFARRLEQAFPGIAVHFEDERLTTEAALERLAEQGIRGPKARESVDAIAAAIIVEARLERLRRQGTR